MRYVSANMTGGKEYYRKLRKRLKADGICTKCRKELAAIGKTLCNKCLQYNANYKREHYTKKEMCYNCGKPLHPEHPDFTRDNVRKSCAVCLEDDRLRKHIAGSLR